jgi:P-type E1-E2 ATPase
MAEGLVIELPGEKPLQLTDLVLDFTGTLAVDGKVLPGVAERLKTLAEHMRIVVLTADTFGTARSALRDLPVEVHVVETGGDKEIDIVRTIGASKLAVIGNGRNDVPMMNLAALGIAVIGPEGCAPKLLAMAHVVTRDITEALDLLTNPLRLKATLRG